MEIILTHMYQVAMYYTVKTLLSQEKSIREIAKDLGMCRKTISRIKTALDNGRDHLHEQVRSKTIFLSAHLRCLLLEDVASEN